MNKSISLLKIILIAILAILISMFLFLSYIYFLYNSNKTELKAAYTTSTNFTYELFAGNFKNTYSKLSTEAKHKISMSQWKDEVSKINKNFDFVKILKPTNYQDIKFKISLSNEPKKSYTADIQVSGKVNNQNITRLIIMSLIFENNKPFVDYLYIEKGSNELENIVP